ncbi:hypothetical protein DMUE_6240, partial [Dictyocoela muelleri]
MLPKEFQRTLILIKKNYKNPIIISILYNHLSSLNNTKISIIDLKDDYSQLILGSQLKHPLSVEKKIPIFIKELKNNNELKNNPNINQKDGFLNSKNIINIKSNNNKYNNINESDYNKYNFNNDDNIKDDNKIILSFKTKFKLIIILYYLILKPIKNHILIFDLMSFIGCSDFIDSLIIKLVQ